MRILVDTSIWSLALRKNGIQGSHIDFDLHEIRNELRHQ